MNTSSYFDSYIEGLTDTPSTAHMVLSSYFGIQEDDFVKLFQVSIQFAILAVVVCIGKKFSIFLNLIFTSNLFGTMAQVLVLGKII
jgi:undecaprenyl-diphosphatase